MMMVKVKMLAILLLTAMPLLLGRPFDVRQLRHVAAKNNVTCILVFGDSSVDPGNNNYIATATKSNFPPYGKNFINGRPSGRFSNGRLATDFIAEALGYRNIIPGFLDPHINKLDLLHGVSFASAGSGYDDLTANLSSVLPVSKQLEYFLHYKIHLRQLVGLERAEAIIRNAIFLISMGTNDFLQNYGIEPIRPKQFTLEQYQNFLISRMFRDIKAMLHLGTKRLVVVGVPPFGCMPLVKTLKDAIKCDESSNKVAFSFNSKIKAKLATIQKLFGIKTAYVDIYNTIQSAIQNPKAYGFTETSKGCCGSGAVEYGDTCKGLNTCTDPSKYIFWDAVHPTQQMYKIIADNALETVLDNVIGG